MDSNGGWIKVHRGIRSSWIWDFDNPKMTMAWLDLLMMMNHSDKKIMVDSEPFLVKRGSRFTSITKLAERWKVTRVTARKWLEAFKKDGMVSTKVYRHGTLITVEKYSVYQDEVSEGYTDPYPPDYPPNYPPDYTSHYPQEKNDIRMNKNEEEVKGSLASLSSSLVSYLNQKTGSQYKSDRSTERLIEKLVESGHTEAEIKTVIDKKVAEWIGSDKMRAFLRPRTLFGDKFEQYLSAPEPLQIEKQKKTAEDKAKLMMRKVKAQEDLDGVLLDIKSIEDSPEGIRGHPEQFNALMDVKIELEGQIDAIERRLEGS